MTVANSILWGNSEPQINLGVDGTVAASYSDISGGYTGLGNINSDPVFADDANGDFSLLLGSPCINRGDPATPDGDGTRSEMGAYAFTIPANTVIVADTLNAGTVWATGDTVRINGALVVATGDTLTIEPGVDVVWDQDVSFRTHGLIQAMGTEADSVRFLPGLAGEWPGIVISITPDTSHFLYTRFSGGNANISGTDNGGALDVTRAHIVLDNCVIRDNAASYCGGGIALTGNGSSWGDCTARFSNTQFLDNTCGHDGGNIYSSNYTQHDYERCVIAGGYSTSSGDGIQQTYSASATLTNCVVADNAGVAFGVYSGTNTFTLKNSIVWGNTSVGTISSATYSDVQGGFSGTGNVNSDPLFVDAANRDYHLSAASPCINTGDPASPEDSDHSTTDMGAWYYQSALDLPPLGNVMAGDAIMVPVVGNVFTTDSVRLVLTNDKASIDTVTVCVPLPCGRRRDRDRERER